jgi:hypothetical protein
LRSNSEFAAGHCAVRAMHVERWLSALAEALQSQRHSADRIGALWRAEPL